MPARTCSFPGCPKMEELKKCSVCKIAAYCSKEHQNGDWSKHKVLCKQFRERLQRQAVDKMCTVVVQSDDVKAVEEYTRKKWDINAFTSTSSAGLTPLMFAAARNRVKCMKALLEAKAGLAVQDPETGVTALHVAANRNNTECVKLLLNANADCNAVSRDGETPLYITAYNGHTASMKLLLKANADCNKANNDGSTPLHVAAQEGQDACMKLLLDAKADYDAARNDGCPPLYVAAQFNHRVCLKMLIDAKADLEKRDIEYEETPLMAASGEGHIDCVSELVEAKANIKAVSNYGSTALDYAQMEKHDDVVAVLTGQSAMVHVKKTKKKKKKKP